jgi:hypothetical protein
MEPKLFDTKFSADRVDAENGVIHGVSVITGGVKARGHKLYTDATTLEQMRDCGNVMEQVPVKWNHRTGADAVNGYLTNFQIKKVGGKNKLLADWHLLTSHPQYEQAIELAERMPKNVGLSAAFNGEDEIIGGKAFARCEELLAVDLVAHPAANPKGLFHDPSVDNAADGMDPKNKATKEPTPTELMEKFNSIETTLGTLGERFKQFDEFMGAVNEAVVTDDDPPADPADPDPAADDDTPPADPPAQGGKTELAALRNQIKTLEARLNRKDADNESAEIEEQLEKITTNFGILHDAYSELQALDEAKTHLLEARGIKFTGEGDGLAVSVEGADPGTSGGGNRGGKGKLSEFDEKVNEFASGANGEKALSRAEAVRKAVKEFPDLHRKHLEAKGIKFKTME